MGEKVRMKTKFHVLHDRVSIMSKENEWNITWRSVLSTCPNICTITRLLKMHKIDQSHLHIHVFLNHQRAYQDAIFEALDAVSRHPTCINHQKKYVHL